MFTIYDYLDYYKNCSFEEVGFNQMDAMLFACLVYLPIKSFSENKSYKDFVSYAYTFYKDDYSGVMKPSSFALLKLSRDISYCFMILSYPSNNCFDLKNAKRIKGIAKYIFSISPRLST